MFMYKIMGIVIFIGLFVGYFFYTQSKIDTLTANNTKLATANKTNTEIIQRLGQDAKKLEKANKELGENLKKAEKYNDELRNTLQKHNLTMLARKKPGLIEKRINSASKELVEAIMKDTE